MFIQCGWGSLTENGEYEGMRNGYITLSFIVMGLKKPFPVKLVKLFPFGNYVFASIYPFLSYYFMSISLKLWLCMNTNFSPTPTANNRKKNFYSENFPYTFAMPIEKFKICVANA